MQPVGQLSPSSPAPSDVPALPLVSAIYWWRFYCTAYNVILRLDGDILTLKTKKETVFQAPIDQTTCHFTGLGTMKLTYKGKIYSFMATTSGWHNEFSKEQVEELRQADASRAQANNNLGTAPVAAVAAGSAVGGIGGSVLSIAGASVAVADSISAFEGKFTPWRNEYERRGLLVDSKPVNLRRTYAVWGVILTVFVIILFVVLLPR